MDRENYAQELAALDRSATGLWSTDHLCDRRIAQRNFLILALRQKCGPRNKYVIAQWTVKQPSKFNNFSARLSDDYAARETVLRSRNGSQNCLLLSIILIHSSVHSSTQKVHIAASLLTAKINFTTSEHFSLTRHRQSLNSIAKFFEALH